MSIRLKVRAFTPKEVELHRKIVGVGCHGAWSSSLQLVDYYVNAIDALWGACMLIELDHTPSCFHCHLATCSYD